MDAPTPDEAVRTLRVECANVDCYMAGVQVETPTTTILGRLASGPHAGAPVPVITAADLRCAWCGGGMFEHTPDRLDDRIVALGDRNPVRYVPLIGETREERPTR